MPSTFRVVFLLILGLLLATLMDATGKILHADMNVLSISTGRFVFHFLSMTPIVIFYYLKHRDKNPHPRGDTIIKKIQWKSLGLHCMRGGLLSGASLCFFGAITQNPIPDSLAVFFVQPLFVALYAGYFLKERVSKRLALTAVIGFVGVLVVLRPGGETEYTWTIFLALVAGALFAGYIVSARFASFNSTTAVTSWATAGFAILPVLPFALFEYQLWLALTPEVWAKVLLLGALSAGGHSLIIYSCRYLPAFRVSVLHYSEILLAVILNWFLFQHFPDIWVWVGICIIIAANFLIIADKQKSQQSG